MTLRVLFYVQHLLGVGHVKRSATLARALCKKGAQVTVAMGGFPVALADFGSARVEQLPPVRAADMTFKTLLDESDQPVTEDWWEKRREAVLRLGQTTKPDVVLIEHYPFGRRAFRSEIEPLLDSFDGQAKVASSVRDVLVARNDPGKNRKIADMVLCRFDRILVHGDAKVIPFEATFPDARKFQDRVHYTGYIADTAGDPGSEENAPEGNRPQRKNILVSTGGGAVGESLLRAAIDAARKMEPDSCQWRLLAGENLNQGVFDSLRQQAPAHVVVERARPDFPALLRKADLSISQGGYNTVMDVISAGCRNLIVPFAEGGESEQAFRAACFEKRGLVKLFPKEPVSGRRLAELALQILAKPRPPGSAGLDMNGAARSAELIFELSEVPV